MFFRLSFSRVMLHDNNITIRHHAKGTRSILVHLTSKQQTTTPVQDETDLSLNEYEQNIHKSIIYLSNV